MDLKQLFPDLQCNQGEFLWLTGAGGTKERKAASPRDYLKAGPEKCPIKQFQPKRYPSASVTGSHVFVLCRMSPLRLPPSSITLVKEPTWHGRTLPSPTVIPSSFFPCWTLVTGLPCNATSCHPMNSFRPGLKSNSSVHGGNAVCGEPLRFMVTVDEIGRESLLQTLVPTTHREGWFAPQQAQWPRPRSMESTFLLCIFTRCKAFFYFPKNFTLTHENGLCK